MNQNLNSCSDQSTHRCQVTGIAHILVQWKDNLWSTLWIYCCCQVKHKYICNWRNSGLDKINCCWVYANWWYEQQCISLRVNKHTADILRIAPNHTGPSHVATGHFVTLGHVACTKSHLVMMSCTLFTDMVRIILVCVLHIGLLNLVRILVHRWVVHSFAVLIYRS